MKARKILKFILRIILILFGIFLIAMNYNMFLIPNNLVTGGTSGLSIIVEKISGWEARSFLLFINACLAFISLLALGIKKTWKIVLGSLAYPLMVNITAPLAASINFSFGNMMLTIVVATILYGVGNGIVYKMGFNTGGSDVIAIIVKEFKKMSQGKAVLITNIIIVLFGAYYYGLEIIIYAAIILYGGTYIVDKIMLGISDSKMFFIYSSKIKEIKDFILKEIDTGVTIFNTEGGYSHTKEKMLMCVVRTRDYYLFREKILEIDPHAFFIINDCYEVLNGVKRNNLPFM